MANTFLNNLGFDALTLGKQESHFVIGRQVPETGIGDGLKPGDDEQTLAPLRMLVQPRKGFAIPGWKALPFAVIHICCCAMGSLITNDP